MRLKLLYIEFRNKVLGIDNHFLILIMIVLSKDAYGTNSPGMALMDLFCPPYKAYMRIISAIYVDVDENCTPWFDVNNVNQGCILSPSLFNICINDLLKKLGRLGFGVHVGCGGREVGVPALAFADDIAVAPTPNVYAYYFG